MADRNQEERVLQQIEREVRMQEGAYKLLAACSRRDQALEVSKSLLTCNARILALLGQLQRMRRARILEREGHGKTSEDAEPCTGKVSLSDLRIPLMWKDSEYFKNKGELHRCAVFCLLQCGSDIHDTDLVMVDRTLTDICFEDAVVLGPKYNLLAQTTLTIEHVREGFKTHDLTLSATEDSPFWLPLFGNMCCRFVAQPLCMTQPVMRGQLKIKLEDDADRWGNFYCVLKGQTLLCYRSGEDSESEDEPLHVIPITKDTTVCTSESHPVHGLQISIRMQPDRENATYAAATQNAEDLPGWNKALQQHVYNLSQWKRCCDEVMKIEAPRSRKPKTARQGSLFHEMAISHPDRDTAAGRRLLPFSSPAVFRPGRNGQEHDE